QAADYPVFKVDDVQAVEAAGIDTTGKKKRDHYSFNELAPGFQRLFELAREYHRKDEKDRTTVEQQVFLLATNVDAYFSLQSHFDYARHSQYVGDDAELVAVFGGEEARFSQVVEKVPELMQRQFAWASDTSRAADAGALRRVLQTAAELAAGTETLALIPPHGAAQVEPAWHTPADLLTHAFQDGGVEPSALAMLAGFESVARAADDPVALEQALASVQLQSVGAASARGEYAKIGLE